MRIEPGEIEALLETHPRVARAAVGKVSDTGGRLAAWVVPRSQAGDAPPEPEDLRAFLAARLPAAMLPAAWVFLEALPLTPSGKIDRRALPAPATAQAVGGTAPRTPNEAILAEVWRRVLGVETVGVGDNFFALGGDSILTLQVVAGARAHGLAVTPRQVFEHPTIGGLAAVAEPAVAEEAGEEKEKEDDADGPFALTPIQRWFFALDQPEPHHFNQALLLVVPGVSSPAALAAAVARLLARHDALRLRFERGPDGWRQRVAKAELANPFTCVDLAALPAVRRPAALAAAAAAAQTGFDLAAGPLFRAVLLRLGEEEEARLLLAAHHLAVDGVSWRILLRDLDGLTDPVPGSFRRQARLLAGHAESAAVRADLPRWLAAAPSAPARAGADLPARLAHGSYGGTEEPDRPGLEGEAVTVTVETPAAVTGELLRAVHDAYRARPDEALLAALLAAAGRLWVDVEGHGREAELFPGPLPGDDGIDPGQTVGWFTALFPVLFELPPGGAGAPGAVLRAVKERLRTVPGRGLSWGLLRYGGGAAEAALAALPRPAVSFNYLGRLDGAAPFAMARESAGPQRSPAARRTHRLEVSALVRDGRLRLDWICDPGDRPAVAALAAAVGDRLAALLDHCRSAEAGGFTPSDFPLAGLDQEALNRLLGASRRDRGDRGVEDVYPLTPAQQGILFHEREAPEAGAYVEQITWMFGGGLDRSAFERAWSRVGARHPVLRTAFPASEEPVQVVYRGAEPEWEVEDWRHLAPVEQEERLAARLAADRRRGFDPARAPLQRLALLQFGDDRWRFLWSHHHLLLDGWSMALVLEEVLLAYEAFTRGEEPAPPPRLPFRVHVERLLHRADEAGERAFWQAHLAGFTEPSPLGIDRPAVRPPAVGEAAGETYGQRRLALPAAAGDALLALGRQRGWTAATLVHAAWALLLGFYGGTDDLVFGTVTSGRTSPGSERIVGLLANTLPVRIGLAAAAPLGTWLDGLQALLLDIRQREATPLPAVRAWSAVPRDRPLFESLVAVESFPLGETLRRWRADVQVEDVRAVDRTHYPLTLVAALDPGLSLTLLFARDRFEDAALDRLEGHLATLLAGMAAGEERPLAALPLLTPAEAAQIAAWAPGGPGAGDGPTVVELAAAQAARTPDAVAVVSAGEDGASLTYRELMERTGRLAGRLRALGVGPEVPVALRIERSLDAVVGLLGILAAGGCCVPLDPAYPRERLELMLDDARPAVFLDRAGVAGGDGREDGGERPPLPPPVPSLETLAYVIYTSGSTGRPKGIGVPHRVLRNVIAWQIAAGAARGPRRTLQFSPWSFDVCLQEIFSTLGTGGTLVLLREEWRADGRRLWRLVEEEAIERLFLPFVALELLAESAPAPRADRPLAPCLAEIATAGEQLRVTPGVAALFDRLPGCALVNHYGPTETHISIVFPLAGPVSDWPALPPIGRAVSGARATVLDAWPRPVPVGVAGEICVGGTAVARGYTGRPDVTAERFIPDPAAPPDEPGARLYRTGDLGRLRADGEIEFLGRRDGQVKVRGVRVELGEIEAALAAHPAVLRAAVVAGSDAAGTRLLAAVVPRPEVVAGDLVAELRGFLRGRLPAPMVPADLVIRSELPVTPSGKVDRRALAALRPAGRGGEARTPPGTALERELAAIWADLLRVEEVGLEDGFFELGGHSLLAGRLLARVRATFGAELSLPLLMADPTLGGMAAALRERAPATSPAGIVGIPRRSGDGPPPLSSGQQRMWLAQRLDPASPAANMPVALHLDGRLDPAALAAALGEVVRRHEVLRTGISTVDGDPVAAVAPPVPFPLPRIDLAGLFGDRASAEGRRLATAAARLPFDLACPPLLRATLVDLGEDSCLLLLVVHHAASDGWSNALLVRETAALYEAFAAGRPSPLPEPAIQYADHAAWQQGRLAGGELDADLAWWRQRLAGLPPLALPTDRPPPAVPVRRAARSTLLLPAATAAHLGGLAQSEGATLFMVLAAGFALFLGRLAGQDDVAFATPTAGRARIETEALIGFFVNTLVLRADLAGAPTFRRLVAHLRDTVAAAHAHGELPFERLVEELAPPRQAGRHPLVRTLLAFQNAPREPFALPGLTVTPVPVETGATVFDLALEIEPLGAAFAAFALHLELGGGLWEESTAPRLLGGFERLLAAAAEAPDAPLGELPMEVPEPRLAREERTGERRGQDQAPPQTARRLAVLWAEVLGLSEAGIHDSFWDLGGHSLLASRLAARVGRELGVELPLNALFAAPTPAELAAVLATGEPTPAMATAAVPRDDGGGDRPLSFGQRRLWFLHHLAPASPVYNLPFAVRMDGALDVSALAAALSEIVRRHEVLRTAIVTRRGEAVQEMAPAAPVPLPAADLSALPTGRRAPEAWRLAGATACRPFDLTRPPLLRALLLRLEPDVHRLLLDLHHIAADGWSGAVLVREAGALYAAYAAGRPSPLPGLPLQYVDFARWQRERLTGGTLARLLDFWRERLAGLPPLALPTDRPRPARESFRGTRRTAWLAAPLAVELEGLARSRGATLFMALAAAFAALLGRLSGQEDFGLATPVAGRAPAAGPEVEGLIGFFVNTLVLRAGLAGDPPFAELLARMRDTAMAAFAHQELPFERLVEELGGPRETARQPLAQALLVLQNAPREPLALPGLTLTPEETGNGTAKLDLALDLERLPDLSGISGIGGIAAGLEVNRDLFDPATAARLLEQLTVLLAAAVADPALPLSALPLLSPAARHQVTVEWNGGGAFPAEPLHERFAAVAAGRPEAVAVTGGEGESLTYGELESRANRLARHLRALGVGPEVRVGLCLPRSPDLVVAMLAITKAGGAYVPLDPDYPRERLAFLLEDSQAALVVTRAELAGSLPGVRHVCLDADVPADADPIARRCAARQYPVSPGSTTRPTSSTPRARPAGPRAWSSPTATPRACSQLASPGSASARATSGPCSIRSPSTSRCGRSGARSSTADASWWCRTG